MASSSLLKLVSEHVLALQVRLEMRTYFINYLHTRGSTLEQYVVTSLLQLISRMTKLGWYEDDDFRTIVEDAKNLMDRGTMDGSTPHYLLGLKLASSLVGEMNAPTPGKSLSQHRKIAVSFRDQSLYTIFSLSLTALRQLASQGPRDEKLGEAAVQLALQCLSFDFVGTCLDESSEDLGTIQIPSSWKPSVEDHTTLSLFFEYYGNSQPPLSSAALECLVRLASARRSLFTSEIERSRFLEHLVNGSRDILREKRGLAHHTNYHEFCRLLGRLKTNYQLSELVGLDSYAEWISLVAEFTVDSLNSWQWASSSVYYLLGLWSRLVSSMPYLKGDAPSRLDIYVPKITEAFILSRLESVRTVASSHGTIDDPLETEDLLQDQLESLHYLARFQFVQTAEFLTGLADPLLAAYNNYGLNQLNGQTEPWTIEVIEGQLTWIFHILTAVVRGRGNSSSADLHEQTDGDLSARIFSMLPILDTGLNALRYKERSRQRLDLALLAFFQAFRKVYVGETVMHTSRVYQKLKERVGLGDHLAVVAVMVNKIATNLKVYGGIEDVIDKTLVLFDDLSSGYMSGKLLLKLDSIAFLMSNHTAEHFPFLREPSNRRARTRYYQTLARLLFMEDTLSRFKTFVAPLQGVLLSLANAGGPAGLRATVPKEVAAGLFRDLRGIAAATANRKHYCALFDWLYPTHFPTITACLEAWSDVPEVTTPLLKFMAEFVLNKSQRLTFDSSSPNGILLFREVSKVVVIYGSRIISAPLASGDPYSTRYKGIWMCMTILTRALGGNYVNFGVFELYGDPAFKDVLDVTLQMAVGLPLHDILAYRKLTKAYYTLIEILCQTQAAALASRDAHTLLFLLTSLEAGLKSIDVSISSLCAVALDHLTGFYFKHMPGGEDPTPAGAAIAEHLKTRPDVLPQILTTLFEIVLFEDCLNLWSLSRPLLTLVIINEQLYGQIKQQIIGSQQSEKQQHLSACIDKLMQDIQRTLDPKNKDKFTQNLTIVRHEIRTSGISV